MPSAVDRSVPAVLERPRSGVAKAAPAEQRLKPEKVVVAHRIAVREDGGVEQIESRKAVGFYGERPELVGFAAGLLASGRDSVRFIWIDPDRTWYSVRIDAELRPDDQSRVTLTATSVAPPFALTPREPDVLTLMCGGLGNHEVAACLETSLRTVTTHMERILAKLGQMSRTGAATLAIDLGLLRLPTPGGGRNLLLLTAGLVNYTLDEFVRFLRDLFA